MCVLWRFIAVLVLVVVGLSQPSLAEGGSEEQEVIVAGGRFVQSGRELQQLATGRGSIEDAQEYAKEQLLRPLRKKRSRDDEDDGGAGSLWQWLTGRDQPNRCVMVSVGGVIGGGALTGAFVGAGIGSIFTGPGTVVGALVGGVVGMFGGISFGHRAGAAACDTSCGNSRCF